MPSYFTDPESVLRDVIRDHGEFPDKVLINPQMTCYKIQSEIVISALSKCR